MTDHDWMRALAEHVERMRFTYPEDELVVVFDIDGTIVDARYLIVHVLLSYDRHHDTDHFRGITVEDVRVHETNVDEILEPFCLPPDARRDVRAWYVDHLRDADALAAAHFPYRGVLGLIRWFQLQPRTHVALNATTRYLRSRRRRSPSTLASATSTARPEAFMNSRSEWKPTRCRAPELVERGEGQPAHPLGTSGVVVDNEPAMISAMAEADGGAEILFLHADTIFASRREPTPRRSRAPRTALPVWWTAPRSDGASRSCGTG